MSKFKCILHGSFNKHFELISEVHNIFTKAGIEVFAPKNLEISAYKDTFALFEGEENQDPRLIELLYLHNLKRLGENGFSYFVNPEGYLGKSASYELGIAQISNIKCFYYQKPADHPAYVQKNLVWNPIDLITYIKEKRQLPIPKIRRNEKAIHSLWEDLMVPGSVVAAGAIIEFNERSKEKKVLLVKTHKWGGRYSIIGGKVRRNERLEEALIREVKEETGLKAEIGNHICTFDEIKNSGYYSPAVQHIFIDNVVKVTSKKVELNNEAEDYLWVPAKIALEELDIEPNARHTLKLYSKSLTTS